MGPVASCWQVSGWQRPTAHPLHEELAHGARARGHTAALPDSTSCQKYVVMIQEGEAGEAVRLQFGGAWRLVQLHLPLRQQLLRSLLPSLVCASLRAARFTAVGHQEPWDKKQLGSLLFSWAII